MEEDGRKDEPESQASQGSLRAVVLWRQLFS